MYLIRAQLYKIYNFIVQSSKKKKNHDFHTLMGLQFTRHYLCKSFLSNRIRNVTEMNSSISFQLVGSLCHTDCRQSGACPAHTSTSLYLPWNYHTKGTPSISSVILTLIQRISLQFSRLRRNLRQVNTFIRTKQLQKYLPISNLLF